MSEQTQPMDDFIDGQRDCRDSKPPQSDSENYLRGYGFEYEMSEVNGNGDTRQINNTGL